ncbi:hypothetical protein DSCO28_68040 [Desulfosarcina ovata subsp. sediminis]|uniref:TonB-dependent receptor plug domain-containing protein n=1 Tax=Desulfosarcina ovata subsp. sediminis TaxID=885957 RepID=A0A5K8A1J5_9BACT|nr:hypothetical protein [Desulfosarcina ovata]BBO86238.1 hypothetical protein DSCO28_68040 [Desulfosarcina ovata subsp. sediminis]
MSIFCRFTIAFCFILLFAINALAEDNVYLMDTIVVTATRSEDNTFDVPTPISTIDVVTRDVVDKLYRTLL